MTPVHAWQAGRIAAARYADLVAAGALVPLDRAARRPRRRPPCARCSCRRPDRAVARRYLKLSLDIQVTSTRRTISVASTRNGPVLSRAAGPAAGRWPGRRPGAADGRDRRLGDAGCPAAATGTCRAIAPHWTDRPARPGRGAVPGVGAVRVSPVDRASRWWPSWSTGSPHPRPAPTGRRPRWPSSTSTPGCCCRRCCALATRHGIGLEAHLQNCVPTFVAGVPHRLALRDLAGLRVHPPRLAGAARTCGPGSVIVTDDVDVMLAKVAYTALQAHLGELVLRLVRVARPGRAGGLGRGPGGVDEVYDELRGDPGRGRTGRDDHAFLTAPTRAAQGTAAHAAGRRAGPRRRHLRTGGESTAVTDTIPDRVRDALLALRLAPVRLRLRPRHAPAGPPRPYGRRCPRGRRCSTR